LGTLTAAAAIFLGAALYLTPKSFDQTGKIGSPGSFEDFADWRAAIPESSNVFLADKKDTGSFVWFALYRPNYLSINQSAGVVFSRATALELKRRSEVMLPLEDPDWQLLRKLTAAHRQNGQDKPSTTRPLTADSLRSVCDDSELGFVIAKESVGFNPVVHTQPGNMMGWNLYDCRVVRRTEEPTS
jgi:hypothetical protein